MTRRDRRFCFAGAILWAVLTVPLVRHTLESSMVSQMLAQIPLLTLAGWWFAQGTPNWLRRHFAAWDCHGVSGLLLASLTGLVWMLPLAVDASLNEPLVTLAKFMSVPLLIGAPIALSWPRAGFVVRGMVLLELIATTFRLGWLYAISPERLCNNYLLDDQQQLGQLLIGLGCAIILALFCKLMWGDTKSD